MSVSACLDVAWSSGDLTILFSPLLGPSKGSPQELHLDSFLKDVRSLQRSTCLPIDGLVGKNGRSEVHGTEQCACMLPHVQSAALRPEIPSPDCVAIDMLAAWPCHQDSGNTQGVDDTIEPDPT